MKVQLSNIGNKVFMVLHRAVEVLYPPCCPFCDQILKKEEKHKGVCVKCQKELVYITNTHCMRCGKQIYGERQEYCYDCNHRHHNYDQARAILSYQGRVKTSLYRFKMSNRRMYGDCYAKEIWRLLGGWMNSLHLDYLIPIPLYQKKEQLRGYNQALVLAKALSKRSGIVCLQRALIKHTETKAQKDLDAKGRQKNLEAAFVIKDNYAKRQLAGKCVLLVDDIYTTGGTVDAAAAILKKAGVSKVYVVTVASGG